MLWGLVPAVSFSFNTCFCFSRKSAVSPGLGISKTLLRQEVDVVDRLDKCRRQVTNTKPKEIGSNRCRFIAIAQPRSGLEWCPDSICKRRKHANPHQQLEALKALLRLLCSFELL